MHGIAISEDLRSRILAVRFIVFDFDGVFTDNSVYVLENGLEVVRCNRGDGIGLAKLKPLGIDSMVISTEPNQVVSARCAKLQIPCLQDCRDKHAAMKSLLEERSLTWNQAAFVGNDINDRSCLECVGVPVVVCDAHPDVAPLARYKTGLPGGHGAVREVCDLFARIWARK